MTQALSVCRVGSFVLKATVPFDGPAAAGSIVRLNVAEPPAGIVTGNEPVAGAPVTVVAFVPGVPLALLMIRSRVFAALEIVTEAEVVAVPAAATFGAVTHAGAAGAMLALGAAVQAFVPGG